VKRGFSLAVIGARKVETYTKNGSKHGRFYMGIPKKSTSLLFFIEFPMRKIENPIPAR
jgi:hypothetical protein